MASKDSGTGPDGAVVGPANVVISAAVRTSRTTTWSVNYRQWAPTYGNDVAGTESLVAAVGPSFEGGPISSRAILGNIASSALGETHPPQ